MIKHRNAADDRSVDRHNVASPYQQTIARFDKIQINLFKCIVALSDSCSWRSGQESRHFAASAALREALEVLPAGIHQRDHGRGQIFPEHQGGGHRQRCDDVEAYIATAQAGDDLDDQHQEHRPGASSPDPSRPRALSDCCKSKPSANPTAGNAIKKGRRRKSDGAFIL